jgi:hypothetical protein
LTGYEWMAPAGFACLGVLAGLVVGYYFGGKNAELDIASLEADLARWKARGAKEQGRADRLDDECQRLTDCLNIVQDEISAALNFNPAGPTEDDPAFLAWPKADADLPADPPEAG